MHVKIPYFCQLLRTTTTELQKAFFVLSAGKIRFIVSKLFLIAPQPLQIEVKSKGQWCEEAVKEKLLHEVVG